MTDAPSRDATRSAVADREGRLTVIASPDNLPRLLALVDDVCRDSGVAPDVAFAAQLAVDEICTNLIHHGYRGMSPGPIALAVAALDDRLVIRIVDRGHRFDPNDAPVPDVQAPIEQRQSGGLGCHLVRKVMDRIDYETTADGENRLTLVKFTRAPS